MVRKNRRKKHFRYLAIILAIIFLNISCNDEEGKFELVLKGCCENDNTAIIYFKNTRKSETLKKYIKTKENLDLDLDLSSSYEIIYKEEKEEIYGKINKIIPKNYLNEKVFLTLNKNKSFRQLLHILNEKLKDNETFYYLYSDNYLFRFFDNNIKKISLLTGKTEILKEKFVIDDNIINLGGKYLINNTEIAYINSKDQLTFQSHNINNSKFENPKYVKIDDDYFFVFKNNGFYDCVRLSKQINDSIKLARIKNCIDDSMEGDNFSLLAKDNEYYIWENNKLYKYSDSKFNLYHTFNKSGIAFESAQEFYLISDKLIYLINLQEKSLVRLNPNSLELNFNIKTFKLSEDSYLITESYWQANGNYYLFKSPRSKITIEKFTFPEFINLKEINKINLDNNQTLFFNKKSFEVLSQKFNSINFYLFSNF